MIGALSIVLNYQMVYVKTLYVSKTTPLGVEGDILTMSHIKKDCTALQICIFKYLVIYQHILKGSYLVEDAMPHRRLSQGVCKHNISEKIDHSKSGEVLARTRLVDKVV